MNTTVSVPKLVSDLVKSTKEIDNYNPYGLRDGHVVSVEELDVETEYGKKCNCICPRCKVPLIARIRGQIRRKHFAHDGTSDCVGAYESALHLLVKEVIQEGAKIKLPPIVSSHKGNGFFVFDDYILSNAFVSGDTLIEPDNGKTEIEKDLGGVRPDIIIEYSGKKLIIEVLVTHAVDDEKRKKIREMGISCIEVDFSYYRDSAVDKSCIRNALAGNDNNVSIKWVFCNELMPVESILKSIHPKIWLLESTQQTEYRIGTRISDLGFKHKILNGEKIQGCPLYATRKLSKELLQKINDRTLGKQSFTYADFYPLHSEMRSLQEKTGLDWDQAIYNNCLHCKWNKGELTNLYPLEKELIICEKGDSSSHEEALKDACSMVIEFASHCSIPDTPKGRKEIIPFFIAALTVEKNVRLAYAETEAISILTRRYKELEENKRKQWEEKLKQEKPRREKRDGNYELRYKKQGTDWARNKEEIEKIIEDKLESINISNGLTFETWSNKAWQELNIERLTHDYPLFSKLVIHIIFTNTAEKKWEKRNI